MRYLFAGLGAIAAMSFYAPEATAQERYIGEIFIVGESFCPRGSTPTNGQMIAIAENDALFSLLGTMYGGDGRVTFALPNLQSRGPVNAGRGDGLTPRGNGVMMGRERAVLGAAQLPGHTHQFNASSGGPDHHSPDGSLMATLAPPLLAYSDTGSADTPLKEGAISAIGGNNGMSILNPSLTLQFCIAMEGIYPSRS